MIIYDLCCDLEHRFEGWFRDAGDFERQLAQQLLVCPCCNSAQVRRVPSAVAIASPRDPVPLRKEEAPRAAAPSGTELKAAYRMLMQQWMAASEDVGRGFAEEARRIHYHEAPERPIHGQASADDCRALLDEGIPVLPLPAIDETDLN